jgi:hypothetical protein
MILIVVTKCGQIQKLELRKGLSLRRCVKIKSFLLLPYARQGSSLFCEHIVPKVPYPYLRWRQIRHRVRLLEVSIKKICTVLESRMYTRGHP